MFNIAMGVFMSFYAFTTTCKPDKKSFVKEALHRGPTFGKHCLLHKIFSSVVPHGQSFRFLELAFSCHIVFEIEAVLCFQKYLTSTHFSFVFCYEKVCALGRNQGARQLASFCMGILLIAFWLPHKKAVLLAQRSDMHRQLKTRNCIISVRLLD